LLLFNVKVSWHSVDKESAEKADHSERDEESIASEVCGAVHGETPTYLKSYLTMEYLWKRKPILVTMMWLTYAKRRLVG
jgi:hypothetical protein